MSMDYIRKTYKVPAARGRRVIYSGEGRPIEGVITGSSSAYLRIQLADRATSSLFHPTWKLEYMGDPDDHPN